MGRGGGGLRGVHTVGGNVSSEMCVFCNSEACATCGFSHGGIRDFHYTSIPGCDVTKFYQTKP